MGSITLVLAFDSAMVFAKMHYLGRSRVGVLELFLWTCSTCSNLGDFPFYAQTIASRI